MYDEATRDAVRDANAAEAAAATRRNLTHGDESWTDDADDQEPAA